MPVRRRLPVGAEPVAGGVHVRVWAPASRTVEILIESQAGEVLRTQTLAPEEDGYFSGLLVEGARPGALYRYRLDGSEQRYPDPASRFQPQGPHGPSQIVDPERYDWRDGAWPGIQLRGQVLYEMHIGTFTPEGTWTAALRHLPALAGMGITALEVMPIADFHGRFGWGYDGVNLFAPTRLYGSPDDFRRFVDEAHQLGLGVVLDVVYNHLGPSGNYLGAFSPHYFTDRYRNEWGDAINFDGERSDQVRAFFVANARYWVEEFHLDGLRLDATQSIVDRSSDHVLAQIARETRAAAGARHIVLIAENEPQHVRLVRPRQLGGYGLDALWNDDFHHSAMVALTGRNEAYYQDHAGSPQELISAAKWGYLFQGQWYHWQKQPRGTPAWGVPPEAFVAYIQNHDQVANSRAGLRMHQLSSPGRTRALTALLLLGPWTPMLFQGQEFGASSPFLYFADHADRELAESVRTGRAEFLLQFPSLSSAAVQDTLADPGAIETFRRSVLDHAERERHTTWTMLHRDLLEMRRDDPVFRAQRPGAVDGAVLAAEAFVLRFFEPAAGADRLLIVNLGPDLALRTMAEPLLAPPEGRQWQLRWSSEDVRYGGGGTPPFEAAGRWVVPGHAALVLEPAAGEGASRGASREPRT